MMRNRYFLLIASFLCGALAACAQDERCITVLDSEVVCTQEHQWTLMSVDVRPDCTILEKIVLPTCNDTTWIASDSLEYIEDSSTGEKLFILDSEIGFEDNKVVLVAGYGGRRFKETYPPLPAATKFINVSSGIRYYVQNLDLSLDISPKSIALSSISFLGIPIGTDIKIALRELNRQGFVTFFKKEEDGLWGAKEVHTYLYKEDDDYPVTIQLVSDTMYKVVTEAEILYQNHIDTYEVLEHLRDLDDEVRVKYPYRTFEDETPDFRNATSILDMKSGENRIFKNVTIVTFRGCYCVADSSDDGQDCFLGTISFSVHQDVHRDYLIKVRYADRRISRLIRRSYGKYRW